MDPYLVLPCPGIHLGKIWGTMHFIQYVGMIKWSLIVNEKGLVLGRTKLPTTIFFYQQHRDEKGFVHSYDSLLEHLLNLFLDLGLLEIGMSVRSNIGWFDPSLRKIRWTAFLIGGNRVGSPNTFIYCSNNCCMSGSRPFWIMSANDCKHIVNRDCSLWSSLNISLIEAVWIGWRSILCNFQAVSSHWNSIVNWFQLHTTKPSISNHWTPTTKSRSTIERE